MMKSARSIIYILLILFVFILSGCGSDVGITTDDGTGGDNTDTGNEVLVADIGIVADEYSINPGATTAITATVYSSSGSTVPGVTVSFSLDAPTLASITASAVTSAAGAASATLQARSLSGEIHVSATVGSVTSSSPAQIVVLDQTSPASMDVSANPTSVLVEGTATITATVWANSEKTTAVPNGTSVAFSMANEFYGTVSSSSTTNNGKATATFEASEHAGFATVKATAGTKATGSTQIEVLPTSAVAISFMSAEPDAIALKSSGGNEISTIKFVVKDSNDNPVPGMNVSFSLKGPNGDEFIDDSDSTPDQIDVSTGLDGVASVRLHSGSVTGPVTISATIDVAGTTMTSESSVVSIGGGVPSAKRFSMASELLNLPGLWKQNLATDISAYLADRFGNYNVLDGTSVSFICEEGLSIDTSKVTADETGIASVKARTQGVPEDVEPDSWETSLYNHVLSTYPDTALYSWGHPRDGWCNVVAYTKGEEHFDDTNANGMWDAGETFIDTVADPFIDYNDDGVYTGAGASDPQEIYIDSGDTSYNGVWDGDKYIFGNMTILITGEPYILFSSNTFDVVNGGSTSMYVLICDKNLNPLPVGTTLSVSANGGGKVFGTTSLTFDGKGPIEFYYTIADDDPETDEANTVEFKVSIVWQERPLGVTISGTVN
ncbi:MAG: hypothetical protein KJ737_14345 [Proteobacteria bacterium]|nr:hypothetical protein [Pseudomonadota bacterium]